MSSNDDQGEWVLSKSLRVGDLLKDKTGEWKPIIAIEKVAETKATYNFEVFKNHDYFVGQNGWLVHNQSLTTSTLEPGQFAVESIPARSPGRDFTALERRQVNAIGNEFGCHTCGNLSSGTPSGNWIQN